MQLHPVDLAVLVLYLVGVIAAGWAFGRKQKDIPYALSLIESA